MKNVGWISIGLGLVSIFLRSIRLLSFLWIITFIIAGIGLLVGFFGMSDREEKNLSLAGIIVCAVAGVIHFTSIWFLLLLGVAAYFVFFRKPKNGEDPNQKYLDQ